MYFTTCSGRIELQITRAQAEQCGHAGSCDDDVKALSKHPKIARQLRKIDPQLLASELREYGAWDDDELADHGQNLQRLLWIACGYIVDNA